MTDMVELGLDTFGDVTVGADGERTPYAQVIRDVVEQAVLADRVGIDVFGVGEHHRDDYAISAPDVVLAAIAGRTERIKLGTAVTVLSSDDPVRVFERFATLDAVSTGRAEITLGRGSFTESFPLFGYDLADYETLFAEKLDLMTHLLEEGPVTWEGTIRAALKDQQVYPKTESGRITTWVGVGGSPQSVVRAASYGLPLVLAVIGGDPVRFAPYAELYRKALRELGKEELPIAVHAPGFVAETDEEAIATQWPFYKEQFDWAAQERGWRPPTYEQFLAEVDHGSMYVGSPDTVARRIATVIRTLRLSRFDLLYALGRVPHEQRMATIALYGEDVIPRVRALLAEPVADDARTGALRS